jgi:hypothetical protein
LLLNIINLQIYFTRFLRNLFHLGEEFILHVL